MRLARVALCLAFALAPACSCGKGKRGAVTPGRDRAAPKLRQKGAAHSATIDMIALAPDGTAAVTRDVGGSVRLWPALDGTREPIPLPARGVEHMTVASNKARTGWTVAIVEASGQGTVLAVDRGGEAEVAVSLPPHDPLYEAHVIAGGERVITLHRDSSIRMLRRDGRELGRFERRKFAPRQLRVSDDGRRVVGIVEEGVLSGQVSGYLYPISVTDNAERLFVGGTPEPFSSSFAPTRANTALSPDGRFFVFLTPDQAGQTLRLLVHDLTRPGGRRSFPTSAPAFTPPAIGFAGRAHVMITSAATEGTAWQISLVDGRTVPRSGPPRNAQAVSVASNMLAAGYGTWLYVQEATGANERYLGYETFRPGAVAFSPKGDWLAWGYDRAEVYIEPFFGPDRTPTRLESDVQDRMRFLFFVDEHHVLGVDTSNTILLVDWTRGEVVAESSVTWGLSDVQFEPDTRVLLLDGAHLGKRIVEVDTKGGFSGQYILPDDARRSGLFSKGAGGGAVLWTFGNDTKLRTYTLAELRRGLTQDEVLQKGEFQPPGNLLAIDRLGNRYVSASGRISVSRGVNTKTIELPTETIMPSFDGKMMLAMQGDRDGVRVTAYDTAKLEEKWTHHVSTFPNSAAWTRDGSYVALASDAGGVVLDAKTGKPIGHRCGLDFEKKGAPPPDAFNQTGLRSMCEP
jgi:hypothetical protein